VPKTSGIGINYNSGREGTLVMLADGPGIKGWLKSSTIFGCSKSFL